MAGSGHEVDFDRKTIFPIRYVAFRSEQLNLLVQYLLLVNIFWGLMNLLPIYPLDGGQIARELLQTANPREGLRQALVLSIVASAGLAALCLLKWHENYMAIFFGYLAYTNYTTVRDLGPTGGNFGRWR